MRKLHELLIGLLILGQASCSLADSKIAVDFGYFAINAKSGSESSSISNPSAFRLGYLKQLARKVDLSIAYSMILADFSGSDLGYGIDLGGNYFFLTDSSDSEFKDNLIEASMSDLWRPYAGLSFHQRNFQSVKNSYAGFGVSLGTERYHSEKINFRAELRSIQLAGSSKSKASENSLLIGVVFKL